LINNTFNVFFPNNIAYEIACETQKSCTTDMYSFKGYVARWLSTVTQVAPFTRDQILPILKTSAQAAVKQCTGGDTGRVCGFAWSSGVYDGTYGAGQQMNVLAAVSSLLIGAAASPVTNLTGGTSVGNPLAGSQSIDLGDTLKTIGTGDRAGASILTILVIGGAVSTFGWMSWGL
jgi:mannan endo-1,6-alpha-mannosidase